MLKSYKHGLDILGAGKPKNFNALVAQYEKELEALDTDVVGAENGTAQAILIKVKNAAELARSQGAIASIAQALAPATIEAKVLATMKDKLATSLKEQNVDADVSVVVPSAFKAADGSSIWTDVAFAVGGAGLLAIIWRLASGHKEAA